MPQWVPDLALNIFSEVVGIVLTVFFIDRIIKNREEKRWIRTKNFIYVRLLRFSSVVAISLVTLTTHRLKRNIYNFGGIAVGCNEFNVDITEDYEKEITANIRPKLEGWAVDHKIRAAKHLSALLDKLDSILNDISHLIDPELLTVLFELRESLEKMDDVGLQLELDKYTSVGGTESFEYGLWKILKNLKVLNSLLLSKAESK
jgi:hypothetical protein